MTQVPTADQHPELSIVIVHYRTPDLLRGCLRSIVERDHGITYEIVVVDNDSRDSTTDMVAREFPSVRLICNDENLGYSVGVNQGLRMATGRYLLVLNPDVEVLDYALSVLVSFMDRHPDAGIVGAQLLNPDGTLQSSCRTFYTLRTLLYRRTILGKILPNSGVNREHLMLDWDHQSVREVDWMMGACLMVSREAIFKVGLMDERFFMYFEDVDWCYRMKRAGWKVYYVPHAKMMHHHRRESARSVIDARTLAHLNSMLQYYEKWNALFQAFRRHRNLLATGAYLVADVIGINLSFALAYLIRYALGSVLVNPLFEFRAYLGFLLFINVTSLTTFLGFGLYRARRQALWVDDVIAIGKGALVSALVIVASTYMARSIFFSRFLVAAYVPSVIVICTGIRVLLRRLHRALRRRRFDLQRLLVVGTGGEAQHVCRYLLARPEAGYDVVGMVLVEGPGKVDGHTEAGTRRGFAGVYEGVPAVGHMGELVSITEKHRVDAVLFADASVPLQDIAATSIEMRNHQIDCKVHSQFASILWQGGYVEELHELPVFALASGGQAALAVVKRRVLDALLSGFLLLVGSSWIAIMLLYVALSPRWRLGRATIRGAEGPSVSVPVVERTEAGKEIPSPAIGRSLMERSALSDYLLLPNVLGGAMSLVGTRPVVTSRGSEEPAASRKAGWDAVPGLMGTWRFAHSPQARSGPGCGHEMVEGIPWTRESAAWAPRTEVPGLRQMLLGLVHLLPGFGLPLRWAREDGSIVGG